MRFLVGQDMLSFAGRPSTTPQVTLEEWPAFGRRKRKQGELVSPSRTGSDLFVDHPIRPVRQVPLARFNEVVLCSARSKTGLQARRQRIGYACLWSPIPERTWSY